MTDLKYRRDVDGLRAVAVLSVLAFHAFPESCKAGFVGVDIFFVISGYLITGIIAGQLEANRFSIAEFYTRRVKRIFPALLTMLACCLAFGWFTLTAEEYRQLGLNTVAGAGFASNLAYWYQAGYFDESAALKPLLHLWSLGVEEQFYIVWPVILWVAHRKRVNIFATLLVIIGGSFALALYEVHHQATAAFYSPLPRAWELLLGAMLATQPLMRLASGASRLVRNLEAVAGVALFAAAALLIRSDRHFPGGWAVLPTVGTLLFLAAGEGAWINRCVLGQRVFVAVGLISYPLYLWHWPALSFAHIIYGSELSAAMRLELLAGSLVLATLTYFAVEKPLAHSRSVFRVPGLIGGVVAVAAAGVVIYCALGAPDRPVVAMNPEAKSATLGQAGEDSYGGCSVADKESSILTWCSHDRREPARYAVIGDSKADAIFWGLMRESTQGHRWTVVAKQSCVPMIGIERISEFAQSNYPAAECARANLVSVPAVVRDQAIHVVLLAIAERVLIGQLYATDPKAHATPNAALDGLDALVKALEQSGKTVVFLIDNPTLALVSDCTPTRVTAIPALNPSQVAPFNPKCVRRYSEVVDATHAYREVVEQLHERHPSMVVFDALDVVCDKLGDRCPIEMNGRFLYSYADHYSDYGNTLVAKKLLPVVESVDRP